MSRKVIVSLLLVGCLLLSGCGQVEAKPVEITLLHGWGTMEDEHVRMREIYKGFEKEHPEIKLNLISMTSSEEVVRKVRDMLSVGEIPDLVFTGGYGRDSIYRFMVENGKAVDLMPYIEANVLTQANISPEIQESWSEEGGLYTVSDVLIAGGGYWYNQEMFEEAGIYSVPASWDEFIYVCDQIRQWSRETGKDVIPVQLTAENSVFLANALLLDTGLKGQKWIYEHEMELGTEEIEYMLNVMKKIYRYDTRTAKGYSYRDVGEMFNRGKVAIYLNGVWVSKLINEDIQVCYAPLPGRYGQTSASKSEALGYIVGNSGNQEKIDASIEFLNYILRCDVQERIFRETGQMPSNPNIQMSAYRESEPRMCQAEAAIEGAGRKIEVPTNFWSTSQIEAFEQNIFRALEDEITAEEFLARLKGA